MDQQERHRFVLDQIRERGQVEVDALAAQIGTSAITVRRDLEHLAVRGALRRVRGGAVAATLSGEGLPFDLRAGDDSGIKDALGAAVAARISDGEAVVVDSGTTGLATARALAGRRISAVPLSVQALNELRVPGTTLIIPGGEVDPAEGTIGGPLTEQTLAGFRFDTSVISCCAVDVEVGLMAYTMQDAAVKRAAMASSARTILVAESAKFSRSAMAVVGAFDRVSVLVTDSGIPDTVRQACDSAGIELVVVDART